jgi:putative oxidoreductase
MKFFNNTFLLRFAVSVILIVHGAGGMFNNGINDFGTHFLGPAGFGGFGLPLAWAIKLSHLAAAACLMTEKFIKSACIITIIIFIAGIIMVHWPNGWFVVGGGRNGIEYNFLLIVVLLSIMFPKGFIKGKI